MNKKLFTLEVFDEFYLKNTEYEAAKNVITKYNIKEKTILLDLIKTEMEEKSFMFNAYCGWFAIGLSSIAIIISFFIGIFGGNNDELLNIIPIIIAIILGLIIFMAVFLIHYRKKYQRLNGIYKELLVIKMNDYK